MPKSGFIKNKKFSFDKLPLSIPCPNESCKATISFNVDDVKSGNTVACNECGSNIVLKDEKS